ncbi:MAG: AtpZ/AtpI family protein [Pseudomonadota bacterium]
MTEKKPSPSLGDLDARLRRAHERRPDKDGTSGPGPSRSAIGTGLGFALRIGIELVAALVVGVGIGFLLDRWLGTGPWLMVVFFFLGSAAGFLNVYRAVQGYGYAAGYSQQENEPQDETPPDGDKGSR